MISAPDMKLRFGGLLVLGVLASSAPLSVAHAAPEKFPKIEGINCHHRAVTTSSKEAQKRFDEGLVLCYAFMHEEAFRRFEAAAQLDSSCAMAYWGMALCLGPNINNPVMDEQATKTASQDRFFICLSLKALRW